MGLWMLLCLCFSASLPASPSRATDNGIEAPSLLRFPSPLSDRLAEILHERAAHISIGGTRLHQPREQLRELYTRVAYAPIWTHPTGLNPRGKALHEVLATIWQDGLAPTLYHFPLINSLSAESGRMETARRAELELLLSDAYFLVSSHLYWGVFEHPRKIDKRWEIKRENDHWDAQAALEQALQEGTVRELLAGLPPADEQYQRLRQALKHYLQRAEAGEIWPQLPSGEKFQQGKRDYRVPILREILTLQGDFPAPEADVVEPPATLAEKLSVAATGSAAEASLETQQLKPAPPEDYFDAELHAAVVYFQRRHGLYEDGVVGENTRRALNVSLPERIHQLQVNLERWRWFPRNPGKRYIRVNVAGFFLNAMEENQSVRQMKVIVGQGSRKTPIFNGDISYMIINPRWLVPRSIAVRDLLPKIRKDPQFLSRSSMQVYSPNGPVNSAQVNWQQLHAGNFPYRLVQYPGRTNALGKVKFMFPNRHGVYLHDTNKPYLFKKSRRTLSSGCVRVEEPMDLADFILGSEQDWDKKRVLEVTLTGKRTHVSISEPVPVYLFYWTAWVDEKGRVSFYEDIYGYDAPLQQALQSYLPKPQLIRAMFAQGELK